MTLADMSVAEVQSLLEEHQSYSPSWEWGSAKYPERWSALDWHEWRDISSKQPEKVKDLGTVFCIADHGGEGEGDDYWFVLKVIDGEVSRYFKMPGWYQSFAGGEYDGTLIEVKPVTREVTFYEG